MEHSSPRYRNATERRNSIILYLRTEGFLSIGDLAQRLGVSHMTVRRDVRHLERTGHVRVVYGGVSLSLPALHDSGLWVNCDAADEARIGAYAAAVVRDGETIGIDAGRLGYEVARALPEEFRGTVVTHSIPVIQLLMGRSRPPRMVALGGEVRADSWAFFGASTVAAADRVRVETLFLTADALDDRGAYARSDGEASVKRALWNIAGRTVVLARHGCFTDSAPLLLAVLDRIDSVVTDRPPPTKMARALRQAGVHVVATEIPANTASADNGGSGLVGHGESSLTSETITPSDVTAGGPPWRSPTRGGPTVMAPGLYPAPNGSDRDRAPATDAAADPTAGCRLPQARTGPGSRWPDPPEGSVRRHPLR